VDLWLGTCNKSTECSYCQEPIASGEYAIFGRVWIRQTEDSDSSTSRRWIKHLRWHAKRASDSQCCWLVGAIEYESAHPHAETRGRKRLAMPEEYRIKRLKILRQRARLVQQMKFLAEAPLDKRDIDRVIKIGGQIEELKVEIETVGGMPVSWS
jgi:hypothetical protein